MPNSDAIFSPALLQGGLMMAGLIMAIGAQNALVIRQGLARRHVGPVVALCAVSDSLLIVLGVFGLGAAIESSPMALNLFRYGGAAFLVAYGLRSSLRAWRGGTGSLPAATQADGLGATLGTALALTYLNPHVYLDTVVLLGTVGAQQGADRGAFALGASLASLMWFAGLGYGASAAARWLARPVVWRLIDAAVALVMFGVAAQLLSKPIVVAVGVAT